MTSDHVRAAIIDMLRAEARKAEVESGARCRWDERIATLTVPSARGGHALQISSLEATGLDALLAEVRAHPPQVPHTVFAYLGDEHASTAPLVELGYEPVVTAPLMRRSIEAGPTDAVVATEDDRHELTALDPRVAHYRLDVPDVVTLLFRDCSITAKTQVVLSEAPTAYLGELVVAPDRRRQGLGARVLGEAERFAANRGCTSVVLVSTHEGRPLYRTAGYETLAWVHVLRRGLTLEV